MFCPMIGPGQAWSLACRGQTNEFARTVSSELLGFYLRDAMLARVLAVVVYLSVCLSDTRLNVESRKQRHVTSLTVRK